MASTKKEKDPCWDGYEMAGTKDKNGKKVPNCVPKKADALISDFLKQADNRALELKRQIDDSKKSKTGKGYFEPAGTRDQPRDKGIKPAKPSFKSASALLENFIKEASPDTLPRIDINRSKKRYNPQKDEKLIKHTLPVPAKDFEPYTYQQLKATNPQLKATNPQLKATNPQRKATKLINEFLYHEAYTTQMNSGSGGNYSMAPSFDATSRNTINPGQGASDPTMQYKTKDKLVPKKQMEPGMDPVIPGKMKEQKRYTGPEQRVVSKPDSNVKMKAPYDRTPLNQEVAPGQSKLEALYPSLFQDSKKPNKLQDFTNWLKGKHEKYFGSPKESPKQNLTDWLWNKNPGMPVQQSKQIVSLVKTAVQDSDGQDFDLVLKALKAVNVSDKEILIALNVI